MLLQRYRSPICNTIPSAATPWKHCSGSSQLHLDLFDLNSTREEHASKIKIST